MGETLRIKNDGRWRLTAIWIWIAALVWFLITSCSAEPSPGKSPAKAQATAATHEGVIVAVGDSLTAGLRVDEDQAYPAQLARKLASDGYRFEVVNAGISGETSSGALSRIDWVISALKPDIVILETGANDGLRGLDTDDLDANLDRILTRLRASDIQVVLAGMRMLSNLGPQYTRAFDGVYPRIARKHQVVFMPFFLQDVAGRISLNQPDNLHPTARGYRRIVDNLYPYVLQAIERFRAG